MNVRIAYAVAGHPGAYMYVGQAEYTDDGGHAVEHDWLRMSPLGGGDEVWVAPVDVVPWSQAMQTHGSSTGEPQERLTSAESLAVSA